MVTKQSAREALEYIQSYIEECDHWDNKEPLLGDIAKFLAEQPSNEFSTPDCPDCACVQDGQCLCTPSKPPAGMELMNEEIARHLGYSDVSDILNGHTILPKDIIDNVRSAISAQQPAAVVDLTDEEITAVLGKSAGLTATKIIRAVIASHEAKKNGGAA